MMNAKSKYFARKNHPNTELSEYENIKTNLRQLFGRRRFYFISLPLKIRGGTGLPVRAVAIFEGCGNVEY